VTFIQLDRDAWDALRGLISPAAKLLLFELVSSASWRDNDRGCLEGVTLTDLAELAACSRRRISQLLEELETLELVKATGFGSSRRGRLEVVAYDRLVHRRTSRHSGYALRDESREDDDKQMTPTPRDPTRPSRESARGLAPDRARDLGVRVVDVDGKTTSSPPRRIEGTSEEVDQFRACLPRSVNEAVAARTPTLLARLVRARVAGDGWRPDELADRVCDEPFDGVESMSGVLQHRLRNLAGTEPPRAAALRAADELALELVQHQAADVDEAQVREKAEYFFAMEPVDVADAAVDRTVAQWRSYLDLDAAWRAERAAT
jgi:hypothetical protein